MFRSLIISMLLLGACQEVQEPEYQVEPEWKYSYTAAECKALSDTLIERCGGGSPSRALEVMQKNIALCEPFGPPQRLSGLWELDLEHSAFFKDAVRAEELPTLEQADESGELTWLDAPDLSQMSDKLAAAQGSGRRVYRVELIGRRSLCDSGFGHMGAYPHQVILKKLLSEETLLVQ